MVGLSVTHKTAAGDTTDGTSYTTASISVNAGNIVILSYANSHATTVEQPSSVTGLTFTWTHIVSSLLSGQGAGAFYAIATSAQTGAITINYATTHTGTAWHVFTIQGANITTPIVTTNTQAGTGSSSTTLSLTLPNAVAANNQVVGAFSHANNEASTAGVGFAVVGGAGVFGGYATPQRSICAEFGLNGTTVAESWATLTSSRGVAFEVKAALFPPSLQLNQAVNRSNTY